MTKKVKFLGIEMETLDADDMQAERDRIDAGGEKPVQLCMRIADMPDAEPISRRHYLQRMRLRCERCGEICWFDPASGPGRRYVQLVCVPCFKEEQNDRRPGMGSVPPAS